MWKRIIITFLSLFSLTACSNEKPVNKEGIGFIEQVVNKTKAFFSSSIKPLYSKQQIEQKLEALSKARVPKNLSFGAMCYEIMSPPDSFTYICPVCSSRTLIKREYIGNLEWEIADCKKEIAKVKGINIELHEIEFCKVCSPKVENPQLYLYINIDGCSDTLKHTDFNSNDIRALGEFLDGETIHRTFNDGVIPLVDDIDKIKKLLGMNLKK